jgi:hypothetical protein
MKNTADATGGKVIAVLLQSISGVSAINPLVAFSLMMIMVIIKLATLLATYFSLFLQL